MNYAAIGSIAGSGLTHGFDTLVQQYGGYRNFTSSESLSTEKHYRQLVQCITDQYSNYTVPEIGRNVSFFSCSTLCLEDLVREFPAKSSRRGTNRNIISN